MSTTTYSGKERIRKILDDLPDDSSFEEIVHELAFNRMIEQGWEDAEAGRLVSHEEVARRIETWRK